MTRTRHQAAFATHQLVPGLLGLLIGLGLLGSSGLAACSSSSAANGAPVVAVTGVAHLPKQSGVPAGHVLEVRVLDVTADSKLTLGILQLRGPIATPVTFSVPFDWGDVDPAHTLVARARVHGGGKELYATPTDTPVITRGAPRRVTLSLEVVAP